MQNNSIVEFKDSTGKIPFRKWIDSLKDLKSRAVIDARITRARLGNFGLFRSLGDGIFELKIDYGPGFRI